MSHMYVRFNLKCIWEKLSNQSRHWSQISRHKLKIKTISLLVSGSCFAAICTNCGLYIQLHQRKVTKLIFNHFKETFRIFQVNQVNSWYINSEFNIIRIENLCVTLRTHYYILRLWFGSINKFVHFDLVFAPLENSLKSDGNCPIICKVMTFSLHDGFK